MKKILALVLLTVAALIALAQIDDDLSTQATNLIDRLEEGDESESYLYLFGIFTKEGGDPTSTGKKLLQAHQRSITDDSYEFVDYPESEKLPLPTGKVLCRSWDDGCLEYLFSSKIDTKCISNAHKTLVSRSNTFLAFDEYKTLSKPSANEIFPPYYYIAAAERIKLLESIAIYQDGQASKAIDSLFKQLTSLRKSMALQDNLIGKLVFLMKLSEIIDVASIILSNENISIEKIPGLSLSEKSFRMIAAREFGMSYHTLKNFDKHPEFFDLGGNLPGWVTRTLFKPNMTINAITPTYYRPEHLAELSPSDFAVQIKTEDTAKRSASKLRNYAGEALINISPDFDTYVARFFDFESKLALFNQVHHLKTKADAMTNPYYGEEKPKVVGKHLCFSGPLEDKRFLRCLRLKL